MEVRFRTSKDEFLDNARYLFLYEDDDYTAMGDYGYLWSLLDDNDYSKIFAKALTSEIYFRTRITDDDCIEYEEIFADYVIELGKVDTARNRKRIVSFSFEELDFPNFIYALLDHFSQWVDELCSVGVTVQDITKVGGRIDISFV